MAKIKLLAISKREYRSEYVFPKQQKFFKVAREFLMNLGFKDNDYIISGFGSPILEETEKPILNKEEKIKEYIDKVSHFKNKKYSIDIFFGKEKIFLIINYKKDHQQEISKAFKDLIIE